MDGAARCALRQQTIDCESRRGDGPAHAPVLQSAARRDHGEFMDGMYYALLEGRFLFDFVHEEKLDLDNTRKYAALVLPNTALLSDGQCDQLREYVRQGGSLLATFETSLYDERNRNVRTSVWRTSSESGRRATWWEPTATLSRRASKGSHEILDRLQRHASDPGRRVPRACRRPWITRQINRCCPWCPGSWPIRRNCRIPIHRTRTSQQWLLRKRARAAWSGFREISSAPCGAPAIPI